MKTTALIERAKDGRFCIFTPDIESVIVGDGESVADAKADFKESLAAALAYYKETGEELPEELRDIEFEYKYDIASMFNYFDFINVSKFAKWAGINASLMRQYKSCGTYISEAQAHKIENALHEIGRQLSAISL